MIILASLEKDKLQPKNTHGYLQVTFIGTIYGKNYRNCKSERRRR